VGKELGFVITDYEVGTNLITGIINYYENGIDITNKYRITKVDVPLIFYHQFVVIQKHE